MGHQAQVPHDISRPETRDPDPLGRSCAVLIGPLFGDDAQAFHRLLHPTGEWAARFVDQRECSDHDAQGSGDRIDDALQQRLHRR